MGNPNQPTVAANVTTEEGLISLTVGGVYTNGLGNANLGWLGNSYFSLPYGYSELLGDMVAAEAANQIVNIINIPDYFIKDDGTKIPNPAPMRQVLRTNNNRSSTGQGNNPFYYYWVSLYAMNNACNTVLSLIDQVTYTGDEETKKNTIKAFCYWWKGWAYANIGSQYYAGLIVTDAGATNADYKTHDDIIAESNANFQQCATILSGISNLDTYNDVLGKLIPSQCQVGNGGVLSPDEWKRNINTMLARNIVVNHLSPFVDNNPNASISSASITPMSASDWTQVITLATDGVKAGDLIFTGRTASVNGFFTAGGGSVSAEATGDNSAATFKVGERFLQNFKTGDKRKANNFDASSSYLIGSIFSTRYAQLDGGAGMAGVYVYGNKNVGEYEAIPASSYEENALMLAEANIRTGNIETGLGYIDDVRAYQGAGIAAVKGTGLTLVQALQELTKERRVALVYRGLSFFDSRRWGWTYDIANGGGSYHNNMLDGATLNTNVTINYNFLDYWDVPADEFDLNPPAAGSAEIKNPN